MTSGWSGVGSRGWAGVYKVVVVNALMLRVVIVVCLFQASEAFTCDWGCTYDGCGVNGRCGWEWGCWGGQCVSPETGMYGCNICPNPISCSPPCFMDAARVNCLCCTATAGYYCPSGTVTTTPCPAGSYCVGGYSPPTPCAEGRYSSAVGASDSSVCAACSAGLYSPAGSTAVSQCVTCVAGAYCPGGRVVYCSPGTYSTTTGASSAVTCVSCTAGGYCAANGTTTPTLCPAGSYCGAGSSSPTVCPAGRYSTGTGVSSLSSCPSCPAGSYCMDSLTSTGCAAGTYSAAGQVACVMCSANSVSFGPPASIADTSTWLSSRFSASSYWDGTWNQFALDGPYAWIAGGSQAVGFGDGTGWAQMDFVHQVIVTAIITQGVGDRDHWVTRYKALSSGLS